MFRSWEGNILPAQEHNGAKKVSTRRKEQVCVQAGALNCLDQLGANVLANDNGISLKAAA